MHCGEVKPFPDQDWKTLSYHTRRIHHQEFSPFQHALSLLLMLTNQLCTPRTLGSQKYPVLVSRLHLQPQYLGPLPLHLSLLHCLGSQGQHASSSPQLLCVSCTLKQPSTRQTSAPSRSWGAPSRPKKTASHRGCLTKR